MSRTRPTKAESASRAAVIDRLRTFIKPGDTVYTVLRHVSQSGMMRHIDCYVIEDNEPRYISTLVAEAIQEPTTHNGAVKIAGCGMDMGFSIVYNLSAVLFPRGFECIGTGEDHRDRCPSNDHSNGDRDYTPHHHSSGGYALRHRWI